jgi:hypothetical protein
MLMGESDGSISQQLNRYSIWFVVSKLFGSNIIWAASISSMLKVEKEEREGLDENC